MCKRVQSDRGEIARLHITLQRRERWVCELFIGHRRPDLRQTRASLCPVVGIRPAHLINTDDHRGNMAALGALAGPTENPRYGNVVPVHGRVGVGLVGRFSGDQTLPSARLSALRSISQYAETPLKGSGRHPPLSDYIHRP